MELILALVFSLVILVPGAVFVLLPLVRGFFSSAQFEDLRKLRRLAFEKEMILSNLRDLETDLAFKKVTDVDYVDLKNKMLANAESIYSAIDELKAQTPFFQNLERDLEQKRRNRA